MAEAQSEMQPLLAHEDVVVWPIIHMIRGVCIDASYLQKSLLTFAPQDVTVCLFIPSSELFY